MHFEFAVGILVSNTSETARWQECLPPLEAVIPSNLWTFLFERLFYTYRGGEEGGTPRISPFHLSPLPSFALSRSPGTMQLYRDHMDLGLLEDRKERKTLALRGLSS